MILFDMFGTLQSSQMVVDNKNYCPTFMIESVFITFNLLSKILCMVIGKTYNLKNLSGHTK